MKRVILSVDGMTCSACSNGLEKYLNKQNGIINASVNLVMANVTIDYDDNILSIEILEKYIKQAGFKSLGIFKNINLEKKNKKEKSIFILFTILSIILMYIAMGVMINLPVPNIINPSYNPIWYGLVLFIFSLIYLIYGFDILKNGYKNLIHKIPNMDTLVSLGVISSFIYSVYSLIMIIKGHEHYVHNLYFESTAIIIYFIKLGRFIDGISKDKTKEAIKKLVEITPNEAIILIDGKEKKVTLDEIKKDDIVLALPGSKIAVDGEIIEGSTHIDESFITGESIPSKKGIGDKVIAGSINYDGTIKYKAIKIGKDSTISEIVRLVIEASNTKAPIAKLADKISGYFVPIVILIAIMAFIIYLLLGFSFNEGLTTFVTILVVACPCSLGLATPLAIVVGEGLCASNGILVKKSEILENISKTNVIVFDKTGTLTYGNLKIFKMFNYTNLKDKDIIRSVASIESYVTHPISRAFTSYIEENNIKKLKVDNVLNIPGYGIEGSINNDKYIIGNSKIVSKYKIKNTYVKDEELLINAGCSIVYVIKNKKIIALIGVNDKVRDNTKEVINSLNNLNIETIMLTGDNEKVAKRIADFLSISKVISNVLPKEKSDVIRNLKGDGKFVIMCGDGINDSPALANADIGISVKSGTDIAMDSADVILINNNLNCILKLLNIGKSTLRKIKQNLFWAFFYNILMIPIAIGILKPFGISINPMIASLAMVFSSLTVIINTLTLKKHKF